MFLWACITSILYQFCRYCVYKKCSGIRRKLKENSMFKCQKCANQQTDIAEDSSGIELNASLLKLWKSFLGHKGS